MKAPYRPATISLVAQTRAALAIGFLLADLATTNRAQAGDWIELAILAGYAACAIGYFGFGRRNWKFKARWLRTMHSIDWITFSALIAASGGFTSAYFAMFAMIVFASISVWGLPGFSRVMVSVALVYLGSALLGTLFGRSEPLGSEATLVRLVTIACCGYAGFRLLAGAIQKSREAINLEVQDHEHDLATTVMHQAMASLGASSAMILVRAPQDQMLTKCDGGDVEKQEPCPHDWPWEDGMRAADTQTGLTVSYAENGQVLAETLPLIGSVVAGITDRQEFIGIPVKVAGFSAFVALGFEEPIRAHHIYCLPQVHIALCAIVHRHNAVTKEAADVRAQERAELARDLHDSAVQSLAAIRLHLKAAELAMRRDAPDSKAASLINTADETAATELVNLRSLVKQLDHVDTDAPPRGDWLRALLSRLSEQWQIACLLEGDLAQTEVDRLSSHQADVAYIIKEAVSNAVRHGAAGKVVVSIGAVGAGSSIRIWNDGSPPEKGTDGHTLSPHTIIARVASRGGTVAISTINSGVALDINFATGEQ